MELGKAKLPRTGLNTLLQAIHPVHGIAWTDGRQVCLTSFYYVAGEPKFGDTNVIGQFEHVLGLFWGPLCCSGSPALLAVQHKKHVTVWQLQLSALEQNKLLCTQTCEMSEPFPLLSHGCVWHPKQDILAILTKQDASVLFSVRVDNRRVKADIRGNGLIHCACWTKDGTRLVVAIGSALHSYIWNDIQKSLVACSFCPVFDVGGYICAIESIDEAQVAVTTELPLDKICGLNAGIAFDLPNESKPVSSRQSSAVMSEDACSESRRRSFDSERSLPLGFISSTGPTDLTQILAKHRMSDPSPLIHLRQRDHLTGSGQDSSHFILVKYERKVTTTRKVSIPGILVPDIMAFDPQGNTVAVASNTCSVILVYSIMASSMPNVQQIHLQKNERPKGLCFLSSKKILVMLGRQKSNDPTFLPSSNTDKYILRLVAQELVFDEGTTSPVVQKPESPCDLHELWRHSEAYAKDFAVKDLVLPGGSVNLPSNIRKRLIEEVCTSESSSADFSDRATSSTSSITLENYDMDHVNRMTTLAIASHESTRPSSPRYTASEKLLSDSPLLKNSQQQCLAKENNHEQLAHNMERIFARFAEVQQCLSELKDFTQNGKKLMSSYPPACEPQYVHVTCQTQLSENVYTDERRPVLLCEGRLCLRILQELFSLTVLEMMHGPMWIILVADADGFVPLTFKHQEELTIRSAKRKLPFKLVSGSNDLPLQNHQSTNVEH
ncbi:WD repeat and coiled-coil-containing protein [Ictalurus furcatus]|uniref:WD repeat and coiled-coil-containing protein n=1 Tax=Ictalurus furcatus TaxID=66913 RepID=UPI0023509F76|nr:WD repeat and coiled-coil-containing protein [Ictalurus furcatus]XP_053470082.1 WD repeat and coiled-coil-containing protein [Ictalurus furcatus]